MMHTGVIPKFFKTSIQMVVTLLDRNNIWRRRKAKLCGVLFEFCSGFVAALFLASFSVDAEEVIFSARVLGPVSNVYAVSMGGSHREGYLRKITENILWRDVGADVSKLGEVVFSSNREVNAGVDVNRHSENFDLYLTSTSGTLKKLTQTPQDEMLPRFSPHGNFVAFIRGRNQLVLLEKEKLRERVLYEGYEILDFDWSPDGAGLAVAVRNREQADILQMRCITDCLDGDIRLRNLKRFFRIHMDSTSRQNTDGADFGSVDHLRWSPDGETIAYIFHPDTKLPRSVYFLSLKNGQDSLISDSSQQVQSPMSWSQDGRTLLYSALVNYRFYYDESVQRKVYQGSMQVFRSDLEGNVENLTADTLVARAPVFVGQNRIAYMEADHLAARQYSLVVRDLSDGLRHKIFDAVSPDSHLVIRK